MNIKNQSSVKKLSSPSRVSISLSSILEELNLSKSFFSQIFKTFCATCIFSWIVFEPSFAIWISTFFLAEDKLMETLDDEDNFLTEDWF